MTAAARRAELAETVLRELDRAWRFGTEPGGRGSGRPVPADVILAAAETYADAVAADAVDRFAESTRQRSAAQHSMTSTGSTS